MAASAVAAQSDRKSEAATQVALYARKAMRDADADLRLERAEMAATLGGAFHDVPFVEMLGTMQTWFVEGGLGRDDLELLRRDFARRLAGGRALEAAAARIRQQRDAHLARAIIAAVCYKHRTAAPSASDWAFVQSELAAAQADAERRLRDAQRALLECEDADALRALGTARLSLEELGETADTFFAVYVGEIDRPRGRDGNALLERSDAALDSHGAPRRHGAEADPHTETRAVTVESAWHAVLEAGAAKDRADAEVAAACATALRARAAMEAAATDATRAQRLLEDATVALAAGEEATRCARAAMEAADARRVAAVVEWQRVVH